MPQYDSSVNFSVKPRHARRSWLPYFLAAVGMGTAVAEEEVLRYFWVMPREAPEKAPRVIRVTGEKGERYEEVYAEETLKELKQHPAIQEARLARQAALRKEALELARQLRESGKEPIVAYEEAWTTVYSRNWLNARHLEGSCKLEDMLTRLADENEDIPFTEEEEQWLLEALLEDDDRLETEAGRELLRRLAEHLRRRGYGKISNPEGLNDELMQRFAAAMRNGLGSMSAYRDALFKTSRDSIMTHSVVGYRAPWGLGLGGGVSYRQSPQPVDTTVSTGNTRQPAPPALTLGSGQQFTAGEAGKAPAAPEKDFLANAPQETEKSEEDEEEKKEENEATTGTASAGAPAAGGFGGGGGGPMMMRAFSMRATAPETSEDDGISNVALTEADLKVNGTAVLYFTNNGLTPTTTTQVRGGSQSSSRRRTYSISRYGSYDGTVNWSTISSNSSSVSFWDGNSSVAIPGRNKTTEDSSSNYVNKTVNIVEIDSGDNGTADKLYMGGANYNGIIRVVKGTTNAYVGSYLPEGTVYNLGRLSGSGTLTLMSHGTVNQASIYSFNDTASTGEGWFSGTLKFGASRGGIVQLNVGAEATEDAPAQWANTVFDLSSNAGPGHSTNSGSAASSVILNLRGSVAIAGLRSEEDDKATVTSQGATKDTSYTLTLGEDSGATYIYNGTFNDEYYVSTTTRKSDSAPLNLTKVGSNTQIISSTVEADSLDNNNLDGSLNLLTVEEGLLHFRQNLETTRTRVYGGALQVDGYLAVSGGENASETLVALQIQNGADVTVGGKTSAYNVNVLSGSSLRTSSLEVAHKLHVDGSSDSRSSKLSITSGGVSASHIFVSNSAQLEAAGSVTAASDIQIGNGNTRGTSVLSAEGDLTTSTLRLRNDGQLVTQDNVSITKDAYLHGGAEWQMSGASNSITGTMYLEGASGENPLHLTGNGTVLTMPGVIDFARSSWTGNEALIALAGVSLDFSRGAILRNIGFELHVTEEEKPVLTLASTTSKAFEWDTENHGASVLVYDSAGKSYHADLGYTLRDGVNYITLKVQHEAKEMAKIGSGSLVYIEMYSNASAPAIPYLAYTNATYNTGTSTWTSSDSDAYNPAHLLKFANVQIEEGAYLYMGEADNTDASVDYRADHHYGGNIQLVSTSSATDAVYLNGQIGKWGNWYLDGHLGSHENKDTHLKLVAHHANSDSSVTAGTSTQGNTTTSTEVHGNASVFTFTSAEDPASWMNGTVSLANPQGGTVQLNVGNVNVGGKGDTRWDNVVVDLRRQSYTDHADASRQSGTASNLVLGLVGDATVAGLKGNAGSSVVSNRKANSNLSNHTLTLGDDTGNYDFGGTIGSGRFYTGGVAHTVTTTTRVNGTDSEGNPVTTTVTTVQENNGYNTREGSLNLIKVGGSTQELSGAAYLGNVEVKDGSLVFSGSASIEKLVLHSGASLSTNNLSLGTATLYGGSSWTSTSASSSAGDTLVYLADVFGADGSTVNSITLNSCGYSWDTSMYLNLQNAGAWFDGADAIFRLADNTHLDLTSPRVITNLDGIKAGAQIAMYSNWSGTYPLADNLVMVEDQQGNFYDATYWYNSADDTLYLQLADKAVKYGIVVNEQPEHSDLVGYIWSGENNGHHVENDVHYINMVMGNVWRADGSAENTGWHEQRAEGSTNDDVGVYENGNAVYFLDTNVHGDYESHRKVDIKGTVAPGKIYVMADDNAGTNGSSEARMEFGYAFVSTDGTGVIADVSENTPTSIIKEGDSILIINTSNTFSGGIEVKDGGLYLAAVGAAGTGTLTFHTDQEWSYNVAGSDLSVSSPMNRVGAELMICYPHSDEAVSGFRGSTLANDIVLMDSDPLSTREGVIEGFKISFAHASFNEKSAVDDHANVPRHWRNLTLSGALVGSGYWDNSNPQNPTWVNTSGKQVIELTGYSSTWTNNRDQSYVTSFTLTEDTATQSLYVKDPETGDILNRFAGKVELKNTVNTSPLPSNTLDKRIGGTVQVTLKGEKLADAELNMTRDSKKWVGEASPRQTYNNILVINGNSTLRGLSAEFLGSGYTFNNGVFNNTNEGSSTRRYVAEMANTTEVWHVRTVTNGLNTLQLGEYQETDNTTYVYAGAMGFAQSYAGTSQAHVPWGDGFNQHSEDWYFNTHSMGSATLSLTKASSSTQYIHTALLQDLSVYEGTLGFNNVQVQGNVNLVGGSKLALGVTTEAAANWNDGYGTHNANYKKYTTSDLATVQSGKTLTVITLSEEVKNGQTVPETALVDGNLKMSQDTAMTFRTNGVLPYSLDKTDAAGTTIYTKDNEDSIQALLTVTGTLTLPGTATSGTEVDGLKQLLPDLGFTLTGLDFSSTNYTNKKYYLVRADEILVGTENERYFAPQTISLGYGYFGTLYTVGDNGSSLAGDSDIASKYDYLVMTVNGDPRRTWHGLMNSETVSNKTYAAITERNYTWSAGTGADYRWKENLGFENGHVVLFGNLYQPEDWTINSNLGGNLLDSDDTVKVTSQVLQKGTLVQQTDEAATKDFNIDSYTVENLAGTAGFQAVKVQGDVAPFSIIINSDYWKDGVAATDSTNYYFYTTYDKNGNPTGSIRNATPGELILKGFDESWQTMLHKTGEGVLVMELDNRYTGGSVLQGGRTVMKHVNALGFVYNTGAYDSDYEGGNRKNDLLDVDNACTITLMNNAALQGDFDDDDFPGNRVEDGIVSQGRAMKTTTIRNTVVVNVYADPGTDYDTLVDGRLINSFDKKLILTRLEGESDTVLELAGVGLTAEQSQSKYGRSDMFRYGVFKVLDPSKFFGTVTMSGHIWGQDDSAAGGKVQLDIMSTTKSAAGADWTSATIDLSVKNGTERTVLALDATGQASDRDYEYCVLDSISGTIEATNGSSSVLNISAHNPITLVLKGLRNGDYDGVLGYGDFQVAVNYGGYDESLQGTTQHHYGAKDHGSLNLVKEGEGTVQKVQRAWLNSLEVQGGTFMVEEALVAHDIAAGRGKRVMVGNADVSSLYALTVGAGGTLAMNTTFAESGKKVDAWEKLQGGTTQGDSNTWVAWVRLENCATLSAREDWYTAKQVDIATDASVTINTHNFAIDPYITESNDVFGKYKHSHIIQLLGNLTGRNVTLNVMNQLTDPENKDAVRTDVESEYMGYVAIMDHNDFTGSNKVNVGAMTALQILGSNGGVEADVDMTVSGKHATVQVVDEQVQYVDHLVLGANNLDVMSDDPLQRVNNGQLILGGMEVTSLVPETNKYITEPVTAGERVLVTARHDDTLIYGHDGGPAVKANETEANISHLHMDLSGASVKLGGAEGHHAEMDNAHVDVVDSGATHTIHHTDLHHSVIHLQEDCSINIEEMVLVDFESHIIGSKVDLGAGVVNPYETSPLAATGNNPTSWTKEVTTSGETTVQLTFNETAGRSYSLENVGNSTILVLQTEQLQGVDLIGGGLTIQMYEDMLSMGYAAGAQYIALMVDGGSGRFLYEQENTNFDHLLDSEFVLQDREGNNMEGYWISSTTVKNETGAVNVSMHMLYFRVPEPATATLSLMALAALCARRRRK